MDCLQALLTGFDSGLHVRVALRSEIRFSQSGV